MNVVIEDERSNQATYEDNMEGLKGTEKSLSKTMTTLQQNLAAAQLSLQEKSEDKTTTEAEKAAILKYLAQIKPGCDFINENYEDRKAARNVEIENLDKAIASVKG